MFSTITQMGARNGHRNEESWNDVDRCKKKGQVRCGGVQWLITYVPQYIGLLL